MSAGASGGAPAAPDVRPADAVVFEPLAPDVRPPERATRHSAGYDLRAWLVGGPVQVYRSREGRVVEVSPGGGGDGGGSVPPDADDGDPGPALWLEPGDRALVPTGFKARLPAGVEAQIRIRSSLAFRRGLVVPNAPGTIDADYPDPWFVLIQNASDRPQRIAHGERIAQAVLSRYEALPWREGAVEPTTDRAGGLGSTGS